MAAHNPKWLITIFPQPDRDKMSGRLANPAQDEKKERRWLRRIKLT